METQFTFIHLFFFNRIYILPFYHHPTAADGVSILPVYGIIRSVLIRAKNTYDDKIQRLKKKKEIFNKI